MLFAGWLWLLKKFGNPHHPGEESEKERLRANLHHAAAQALEESSAALCRASAMIKDLSDKLQGMELTRELEQSMLASALRREAKAKAAVTSVLQANGASASELEQIMAAIDSEDE